MSKTFTSKPAQAASRGRGRGQNRKPTTSLETKNMHSRQNRQELQDEFESSGGGHQPGNHNTDRVQRRDAFTMIAPKPEKRQAITAQAKQEEEKYQRYKEQKKLGPVSYVGTVGGGAITEDKSRVRAVNQSQQAAFNVRQKSQQYRDETRRKEMEKHDKMKQEQRKKTEANTSRDSARQRELKEDHKVTNEAFLQKLEKQQQQKKSAKILGSSAAAALDPDEEFPTYSQDPDELGSYSDQDTDEPSVNPYSRDASTQGIARSRTSGSSGYLEQGQAYRHEGSHDPVDILHQDFPGYDRDVLENLLLQCNGQLDKVRELIGS